MRVRRSPVLLIAREITVSVTTRRVSVSAIEGMLVTDVRFNHVLSEDVVGTEYVIPIHIVVSVRKILEVLDVQLETRARTHVLDTVYVMQILPVSVRRDGIMRIVPKVAKGVKEFATIVCATARKDILARIVIRNFVVIRLVEAMVIVILQRVNVSVRKDTRESLVERKRIVPEDVVDTADV